jgi:hypothetical protein
MKIPFDNPLPSLLAGIAAAIISVAFLCAAHVFFDAPKADTAAAGGGIARGLPPKQMTRGATSAQIGKTSNPPDLARAARDAAER